MGKCNNIVMSIENNMIDVSTNNPSASPITFEESKFKIKSRRILGELEVPTMIRLLVNKRIVKNEKQAISLMLIFVILLILTTIFFFNKSMNIPVAIPSPELNSNNK